MADLSNHQSKIVKRYYDNQDNILSTRLAELVSELWLAEDKKKQTSLWGKAQVALMKLGVDPTKVGTVVKDRDLEALAKLAQQASAGELGPASKGSRGAAPGTVPRGGGEGHKGAAPVDGAPIKARGATSLSDGRTVGQMRADAAAAGGYDSLEEANLKRALKAFRRKLKNYRRDDESRLSRGYTTAGKSSTITAVEAPKEFPGPVWDKLIETGRLKRSGGGTLELP